MRKLKPCPCGKTPAGLMITDTLSGKWIEIAGTCCGVWTIEIRNNYAEEEVRLNNAVDGWNEAARGESNEDKW